ncbi:hypothetical protein [Sphingomonas sp. BE138]|uniref:hypothetical protein n=1 Tax=Sphingomonas sp. BE138 TaxID=2817845 RepID=UPI00286BD68A|nr:hypothetical protein [Sphingomonas sp. BE138]
MLSLILLSLAAAPQTAAATAVPATQSVPVTAPQEKPICRRVANIGSNIPSKKMCYSKAQWDMLARNSQAMKRSMEPAWTTPNQ